MKIFYLAKNLVGKNGYLIIDQIAFKRGISPLNTQIINGKIFARNKKKTSFYIF
jgi:hypothetical protein